MKITALLVLKCDGEGSDPIILANASDVTQFGYFERSSVKQFLVFASRTVAKRQLLASANQCSTKVHAYNSNGLCALGFMDDHYPVRSAFSLLDQVLDEYRKSFSESWRAIQAYSTQPWPYLAEALSKFQHKTIDSVLMRGEKLDNLVEKSSDLNIASQMFYKQAKKTNQCCNIL